MMGSVALMTVIALTVLLVSVGSALVLSSADYLISGRDFSERLSIDLMSRTCLEEGMYRLKLNKSYVGTFTYTDGPHMCEIEISLQGGDPNLKQIEIDIDRGNYSLTNVFQVDMTSKPYQVTK